MKITGLDLSLTSTGVAHIDLEVWADVASQGITVARLKAAQSLGTGHERLQWLLEVIGAQTLGSDLVAIEGPSFGSPNKQHAMGGLWWLVAHGLYRRGTPYVVITPGQLKVYATGRAGAGKDEVLAAVVRRYLQVEVTGNDEADALVLACMVTHQLGCPVTTVPETHKRALSMVNWPEAFGGTPDHQTA